MLDHIDNEFGKAWVGGQHHARRGVFVPLVYIDINKGNLYDALTFAQIMHWHEPSLETGKTRLRIKKDGHWWLAKNHAEWEKETGIKTGTARKCLDRLRERKLIFYELHGFAGVKTPYIRVNWDEFERRIKAVMEEYPTPSPSPTHQGGEKNPALSSSLTRQEEGRTGEEVKAADTPATREQGGCMVGQTPATREQPPCPERTDPLLREVKPNTEITTKTTAENTTESLLERESDWRQGPVPIPRLLLLPPPKINAGKAIAFFEKNISKAKPFVRGEILAACQVQGEEQMLAILRDAAGHGAKGWPYVETILQRMEQDKADELAREKAYREMLETPPLNPLPTAVGRGIKSADEACLVPTELAERPVSERVQIVCSGGRTAAAVWQIAYGQLELQVDKNTFSTWVRDLRLVDYRAESNTFVVEALTARARDLCAKSALGRQISRLLSDVSGRSLGETVPVEYVCAEQAGEAKREVA